MNDVAEAETGLEIRLGFVSLLPNVVLARNFVEVLAAVAELHGELQQLERSYLHNAHQQYNLDFLVIESLQESEEK